MKKRADKSLKGIILLTTVCLFSISVSAQSKADFSGNWVINNSESTLGQQFSMAPSKMTITQTSAELSYERVVSMMGNESTQTSKFTLDGKESVNPGFQGQDFKSTATWSEDGKKLTIETSISMGGNDMKMTEIYSKEGNKLVVEQKMSSPMGEMTEKWVFDKA